MADSVVGNALSPITQGLSQGVSVGGFFNSELVIFILFFVGFAVISIVGAFIWFHFSEKKKWNIKTRVHYENPRIGGIKIGDFVPTKRVRFKDGRVVYMYKTPIQGYTISPELLTWSAPREHDVIVTQDKKLFCIDGISSIETQRKKLNVDVSYPDIEMDRQDLQKHIDSKKFDDPNERFKIIAKVALYVFICITVIVLAVLGGKYYVDGKNADAARSNIDLQTSQTNLKTMEYQTTFLAIMKELMPESFKAIDGKNLLNGTITANG